MVSGGDKKQVKQSQRVDESYFLPTRFFKSPVWLYPIKNWETCSNNYFTFSKQERPGLALNQAMI